MVAPVKYLLATEKMVEGGNMGSDTWQVILSNTAPVVATDTTAASATELSTSGGYTAGGNNAAVSSATSTAGVYKLVLADPATWTGSGAASTVAGGSDRQKQKRKVLKDIRRLNELVIRDEAKFDLARITPEAIAQVYDETDDEEALMLLFA